jgi:hypothetical protein
VKAVRAQGRPCWYLLAKDEGHGFGKKKNADFQFMVQVAFLREHLLKPGAENGVATFAPQDWLTAPVRVHLLSSRDTPALHTTLSESDVARIFAKANKVWAQAGIQFRVESIVREEARAPEADAENPLDEVAARAPAESRARDAFNVYFVKELPVNGFFTRRGMFVKDTASLREVEGGIDEPIPRVMSHEIGHAFTLPHRQDRTNLMQSGTTGMLLNEAEIEQARSAAAAMPWIERGKKD